MFRPTPAPVNDGESTLPLPVRLLDELLLVAHAHLARGGPAVGGEALRFDFITWA